MDCRRVRLQTNSHSTLSCLCPAKVSVQMSLTQRASQPSPLIAACPQLSPFFTYPSPTLAPSLQLRLPTTGAVLALPSVSEDPFEHT